MILTREQYDAIAKGQPHVVRVIGKLKKSGPATVRNEQTGEIQVFEDEFKARSSKCPKPVDSTCTMRYREKDDGPVKGNLTLIVTDVQQDGPEHWLIRWERVTQHRPVPIQRGNVFLARGGSYTRSADQSIDREAPVFEDDGVSAMIADELAARREMAQKAAKKAVADLADVIDPKDTGKLERAQRILDELAA